MSIFNIDYEVLVKLLLPKRLRGAVTIAWLNALIAPVKTLYANFMAFKSAKDYDLSHNSQVCRLEAVLNDRWDRALRRIQIVDTTDINPTYFYLEAENKPEYFYLESEALPKYFYLESETIAGYDFEIRVPILIPFDMEEMKALTNKYKLPGRTFEIKTV